jgi:hypothetical protein
MKKFNEIIKDNFSSILFKFGFNIEKEDKNILKYKSNILGINFIYNERENSHFVEIGKINDIKFPLNNAVIKNVFNSNLIIENVSLYVFVKNMIELFNSTNGENILNGEIKFLKEFVETESNKYTSKLINEQMINNALLAWENKKYNHFVVLIDKMSKIELSKSILLKYKIAKQNLNL